MTAYVLWGLVLAHSAGVKVKDGTLERAAEYLDKELVEEENAFDLQAWLLHALAEWHAAEGKKNLTPCQTKAFENLWTNRERLNAFARALLTLSAQRYGFAAQAKTLVENLRNGVRLDQTPDVSIVQQGAQQTGPAVIPTAHWGEDGLWWRWSDGPIESTAFALRAILAVDPKHGLVEPVTNWLIKNRRGAQWSNTRDTAITVLALNDYLRASGEVAGETGYEVTVNGAEVAERELKGDELLAAPSRFGVPAERLRDGANEVCIRRTRGQGPLYFSAEARFFSLEEPVTPAGHELFVRRQYYRLAERPTLLKGVATDRQLLEDGGKLVSGERVEVVVTVETKNDYEYLVFEDLKPAGLEAVEIRSGSPVYAQELKSRALAGGVDMKAPDPDSPLYPGVRDAAELTGRQRWVYQELRDRKVAPFVDKLPQGYWEIRYQLRAEVPGQFHALPLLGQAMYVPEIRANGAELRLTVEDRK
jgi:uncharacterized protein YfaS (alpha-2-macroglobulin family)